MACRPSDTTAEPKARNAHPDTLAVDFFQETIIFTKMNVLAQPGAFALAQAQALPTSVPDLFPGVSRHN